MAAEGRERHLERHQVRVGRGRPRVAEHDLGLLAIGLVDQLDAPAAGRDRHAQHRLLLGRPLAQPVERARELRRQRRRLDVARRREDQVAADELLAEVRRDLVGGHVVEVGARAVGRVPVGVVAVQVLREEARAQRLVVVAGLVDLRLDLAPRALHLGGAELRAHHDVAQDGQERLQVARQHLADEAHRIRVGLHLERGAQRVERLVELRARAAARAPPRQLGAPGW